MLVRSEAMYHNLMNFVENNRFLMDGCRRNYINHRVSTTHMFDQMEVKHSVFSPEGGLFIPAFQYSCVLLAFAFIFGIGYEIWRNMKRVNNSVSDIQMTRFQSVE